MKNESDVFTINCILVDYCYYEYFMRLQIKKWKIENQDDLAKDDRFFAYFLVVFLQTTIKCFWWGENDSVIFLINQARSCCQHLELKYDHCSSSSTSICSWGLNYMRMIRSNIVFWFLELNILLQFLTLKLQNDACQTICQSTHINY